VKERERREGEKVLLIKKCMIYTPPSPPFLFIGIE
jgi:hypothetical protein